MMTEASGEDTFARYARREITQYLRKNYTTSLGGEECKASILVLGVDNYDELMEGRKPKDIMDLLNSFYRMTNPAIFRNHGRIDKYLDRAGVLATFGVPISLPHAELSAVQAAKSMRRAISRFNEQVIGFANKDPENSVFKYAIGITTGEVALGNIGSVERLEYTVVGAPVTLAFRAASLAKDFATDILIDEETLRGVQGKAKLGKLHMVVPRGAIKPHVFYPLNH